MSFNKKLQSLRKKKGMSQEGLAELLDVSRQAVTKWEKGDSYPEIDTIIKISMLFNVTLDGLLKKQDNCDKIVSIYPNNINGEDVIRFLCKAKRETYASSGNKVLSSRPSSNDLEFIEGDFRYIDTYLGSERFVGEEAIWIKESPYWAMNYSGRVIGEGFKGSFLKEALLHVPEGKPYRGPSIYEKGDYKYHCMVEGDFTWFKGKEEVYLKEEKIYECIFHGGIIK